MRCQRCRGLMVCETFDDLNMETNSLYSATRCINCGCIEDAVVRANRSRPSVRRRATPRRRVRYSVHQDSLGSVCIDQPNRGSLQLTGPGPG